MNYEIMREPEVHNATQLSRTTRWRLEKEGDFPERRQLSPNTVGWLRSEIEKWIAQRTIATKSAPTYLNREGFNANPKARKAIALGAPLLGDQSAVCAAYSGEPEKQIATLARHNRRLA